MSRDDTSWEAWDGQEVFPPFEKQKNGDGEKRIWGKEKQHQDIFSSCCIHYSLDLYYFLFWANVNIVTVSVSLLPFCLLNLSLILRYELKYSTMNISLRTCQSLPVVLSIFAS